MEAVLTKQSRISPRAALAKPLSAARLEKQRQWVELCDATDPALTYLPESKSGQRMQALNFETIHQGIVR